ncbi:unnamed protein product [marine sediment metagenome]|uniref:Uncharacterized protein n=1 Tax=marine sediment metagenome TaxID=412755 RepID=X0Y2B3_9ZZZZ
MPSGELLGGSAREQAEGKKRILKTEEDLWREKPVWHSTG